jgi:hypothetical protein
MMTYSTALAFIAIGIWLCAGLLVIIANRVERLIIMGQAMLAGNRQ